MSRTFLLAEAAAFGALIIVVAGILGAFAPDARASATSTGTTELTLSPVSGPAGSTVSAYGAGYGHNTVQLLWDGVAEAMPQIQANGNGTFRTSFRVPATAALGAHVVSATLATGTSPNGNRKSRDQNAQTYAAAATFTVQLAASATPLPTATPPASSSPTVAPTPTPSPSPKASSTPSPAPTSTVGIQWSMHPNLFGTDSTVFEIPPYYSGRTDGVSYLPSIPGPLGGIVEQQTPGGALQADSRLWVINPPAPQGNPAPWCVWDSDDHVRGDFVGTLPAGGSVSVTVCMIADTVLHRASISLVGYPQLAGTIVFGEHMTLGIVGGRNACVVGPRYKDLSDTRLSPISNTNYRAVGRYQSVRFTVTNPTASAVSVIVPMILGRYQGGAPYYPESRWCPNDTSDQGGPAIWQYGHWLYTATDVSLGIQPGVWWAN